MIRKEYAILLFFDMGTLYFRYRRESIERALLSLLFLRIQNAGEDIVHFFPHVWKQLGKVQSGVSVFHVYP